jgi:hypothetical protein
MQNDEVVEEWPNSQKPSARSGYQTYWKYFVEYVSPLCHVDGTTLLKSESRKSTEHLQGQWSGLLLLAASSEIFTERSCSLVAIRRVWRCLRMLCEIWDMPTRHYMYTNYYCQ